MAIQTINTGAGINTATQTKPAKSTLESKNLSVRLSTDEDTVQLTSVAQDIKKASDASTTEPVVNEKRIAEIKTALEAGDYKIDPERVANKMLHLETQLTNST